VSRSEFVSGSLGLFWYRSACFYLVGDSLLA